MSSTELSFAGCQGCCVCKRLTHSKAMGSQMGHQDFQCSWEGAMEVLGSSRTTFTPGFSVCIQPLRQPAPLPGAVSAVFYALFRPWGSGGFHRLQEIPETLRLENTSKIKPNLWPNTPVPTIPYLKASYFKVPHLLIF